MKRRKYKTVTETVNKFKTKSKYGFNKDEMIELVLLYGIDANDFYWALGINTGIIDNGKFITYAWDVEMALKQLVEKYKKTVEEWD